MCSSLSWVKSWRIHLCQYLIGSNVGNGKVDSWGLSIIWRGHDWFLLQVSCFRQIFVSCIQLLHISLLIATSQEAVWYRQDAVEYWHTVMYSWQSQCGNTSVMSAIPWTSSLGWCTISSSESVACMVGKICSYFGRWLQESCFSDALVAELLSLDR